MNNIELIKKKKLALNVLCLSNLFMTLILRVMYEIKDCRYKFASSDPLNTSQSIKFKGAANCSEVQIKPPLWLTMRMMTAVQRGIFIHKQLIG